MTIWHLPTLILSMIYPQLSSLQSMITGVYLLLNYHAHTPDLLYRRHMRGSLERNFLERLSIIAP